MAGPKRDDVSRIPSGVVAFLFTDVEGSTRLWAKDADAASASLKVHDALIREAIESRGGFVFTTAGDSFAAAFSHASAALDAATAAQATLGSTAWPGPELRVRMGVHLGEAEERGGDYFGPVVNACARVEAAGHGGQVLITEAVRLVVDVEPMTDLGSHKLRDLPEPVRLFQVGAGEFARLRGIESDRDSLPVRRTRLLGRDAELGELTGLLLSARLVTIVGPGGIGKTSLAVEAAGKVSGQFPGGAHFVDLAAVTTGEDVVGAVCRGLRLVVGGSPYEQLVDFLAMNETLVVIDNCEHVIDDAAEVIDRLLSDVPGLRVMSTSREHLDLDGERVVRLDPLATDDGSAAVRLFVERVIAAHPGFDPGQDEMDRIQAICVRLDGLPLAIELAAARARTMSIAEIEERLGDRFSLLAGGRRGKLRRQQTLRATLDWSIELLEPGEKDFLARLAVYVDGFGLEGAAAVMEATPSQAADIVDGLAAKSLVQRSDDQQVQARYRLLETVREWGLDDLAGRGLLGQIRDLHAQRILDAHAALDTYGWLSASTDWQHEVADLVTAIEHLRDDDPVGAAIIAAPHAGLLTESGHGPLGLEIVHAGAAVAPPALAPRLWCGKRMMEMLTWTPDPLGDPGPPDDGSVDWHLLVGGPDAGYAGLMAWFMTWVSPAAVIDGVAALPPPGDDIDALMVRASALANACIALTHLGRHREGLEVFSESMRLISHAGQRPTGVFVYDLSFIASGLAIHTDLRESALADPNRGIVPSGALAAMAEALINSAPGDRPVELARAARAHSHGRLPGEESAILIRMAFFAIEEGDVERGRYLNETAIGMRAPDSLSLKRHNAIRANGLPIELMADEGHHLEFLAAETAMNEEARQPASGSMVLNRQKMLEEIARLLD